MREVEVTGRVGDWRGKEGERVIRRTVAPPGGLCIPGVMLRWLLTTVITWDLHHELYVEWFPINN